MTQMDCSPAKEILGLDFKPWQSLVEETVDKLVEMEKAWQPKAGGGERPLVEGATYDSFKG